MGLRARDLRLFGQPRMAAGEHHAKQVVFDRVRSKKFLADRGKRPFALEKHAHLRRGGWPGSLMWPCAPRSFIHATHFSMVFCICSGDVDASPPRNRYVNSLLTIPPWFGTSTLRGFAGLFWLLTLKRLSGTAADIFLSGAKLRQENLGNRASMRMYSQLPRGANGS